MVVQTRSSSEDEIANVNFINDKLIYDLLVINANLRLSGTVSKLWLIIGQIVAIARGECLTLTLSLGVMLCQYPQMI